MLLTAFYIVYACSQWEILMLRFVQPRIWLFFVCMAWGLASAMQGVTTNFGGMITCVSRYLATSSNQPLTQIRDRHRCSVS